MLQILNRRPDIHTNRQVQAYSAKRNLVHRQIYYRVLICSFFGKLQLSLDSDLPDLKGYGGLVSAGMILPILQPDVFIIILK